MLFRSDVDLFDASVVTRPQYSKGTTISARAAGLDGRGIDEFHRHRLQEQEYEILRDAPGFRITPDLRVVPMSQTEVDVRTDAQNQLRAERQARQIARDAAREEIEELKEAFGL